MFKKSNGDIDAIVMKFDLLIFYIRILEKINNCKQLLTIYKVKCVYNYNAGYKLYKAYQYIILKVN